MVAITFLLRVLCTLSIGLLSCSAMDKGLEQGLASVLLSLGRGATEHSGGGDSFVSSLSSSASAPLPSPPMPSRVPASPFPNTFPKIRTLLNRLLSRCEAIQKSFSDMTCEIVPLGHTLMIELYSSFASTTIPQSLVARLETTSEARKLKLRLDQSIRRAEQTYYTAAKDLHREGMQISIRLSERISQPSSGDASRFVTPPDLLFPVDSAALARLNEFILSRPPIRKQASVERFAREVRLFEAKVKALVSVYNDEAAMRDVNACYAALKAFLKPHVDVVEIIGSTTHVE